MDVTVDLGSGMEDSAPLMEPQEPTEIEDGQSQEAAQASTAAENIGNTTLKPPTSREAEDALPAEADKAHPEATSEGAMQLDSLDGSREEAGEGQYGSSVGGSAAEEGTEERHTGSAGNAGQVSGPVDSGRELADSERTVIIGDKLEGGVGAIDGSSSNESNQELLNLETGEAANEEALAPELVAEAADERSIPLEAALSHLPEDGSMPFLEQRLQAAGQLPVDAPSDVSAPSEEAAAPMPSAVATEAPEGSGSDAQGEEDAPPVARQSLEEMLEDERRRRQVAEGQVDSLRKQLEEATVTATQAQEQADTEAATRRELEDMMVLIEKHFKESQAARRAAEEGLDEARRAMQAYADKWEHLEQENQRLAHAEEAATRVSGVQAAVAALEAERADLAAEKEDAEKALGAAQQENKRLASAVNKAEEAAKNAEQIARMKAEAEQHAVMLKMGAEIERLRLELEGRTRTMHVEMEKWRGQAEAAATSIREAKNEVLDRKRELDMTKEKMDALVEKLYIGREIDMELRGAIDYSLQRSQHLRMTDQAAFRDQGALQPTGGQSPAAALQHAGRTQGPTGAGPASVPSRKALPGSLHTGGGGTVKLPAISPRNGKAHSELASQDKAGGGRGRKTGGEEGPGDDSGSPMSSSGGYARMYDSNAQHKQAVLSRAKGEGKVATSGSPKKGEKGVDRFAETKRIQMMVSHSNRWP